MKTRFKSVYSEVRLMDILNFSKPVLALTLVGVLNFEITSDPTGLAITSKFSQKSSTINMVGNGNRAKMEKLNKTKFDLFLITLRCLTLCQRSFNSQKTQPNLIPSKMISVG